MARFIIEKNGTEYYHKGIRNVEWTTSKALATVFVNLQKAQGVVDNHVSKSERQKCTIIELDTPGTKPNNVIKREENTRGKNVTKSNIKKISVKDMNSITNNYDDLLSEIDLFSGKFQETIDKKQTEFQNELSDCDLEVQDILHYIEFSKLDVINAWKIYDMLRKALRKRRKIKNQLEIVSSMSRYGVAEKLKEEYEKSIDKLKNKKYSPRMLGDLFE